MDKYSYISNLLTQFVKASLNKILVNIVINFVHGTKCVPNYKNYDFFRSHPFDSSIYSNHFNLSIQL